MGTGAPDESVISGGYEMRASALALSAASLLVLAGCSAFPAEAFTLGDPEQCDGVTVVVNYGLLSSERDFSCV